MVYALPFTICLILAFAITFFIHITTMFAQVALTLREISSLLMLITQSYCTYNSSSLQQTPKCYLTWVTGISRLQWIQATFGTSLESFLTNTLHVVVKLIWDCCPQKCFKSYKQVALLSREWIPWTFRDNILKFKVRFMKYEGGARICKASGKNEYFEKPLQICRSSHRRCASHPH